MRINNLLLLLGTYFVIFIFDIRSMFWIEKAIYLFQLLMFIWFTRTLTQQNKIHINID